MNAKEPNFLTHLEEIRGLESQKQSSSIIIYCGTIASDVNQAFALQAQQEAVEEEVDYSNEIISGILMAQGNSILHLLEGPSESILRILKTLSLHTQFINGQQHGRIVLILEDRDSRCFPEWYACSLQEIEKNEISLQNDPYVVVSLMTGLSEIGIKLQTESQQEVELNRYAEYLPSKNLIQELSDCHDYFTLQDFVNTYTTPMNLVLESEKAWPLERLVNY